MYERVLSLLEAKHIRLDKGLTHDELFEIEGIYDIVFPNSLKSLLMVKLPISKGFYNWRNKEQQNVDFIKSMLNQPLRYINEMPEEVYWCEDWGKEPKDKDVFKIEVKRRLSLAPKLIPIFSHRYMPVIIEDNPPIISVHGGDIIYMGEDIIDYFYVEFGEKNQKDIRFSSITPIPFWSDLM